MKIEGETGYYFVKVNDECCEIKSAVLDIESMSIEENELSSWSLYPNLVIDILNIEQPKVQGKIDITIYDILGRTVLSDSQPTLEEKIAMSLETL